MSDHFIIIHPWDGDEPRHYRQIAEMSDSEKLFWARSNKPVLSSLGRENFWDFRAFLDTCDQEFVRRYRMFLS